MKISPANINQVNSIALETLGCFLAIFAVRVLSLTGHCKIAGYVCLARGYFFNIRAKILPIHLSALLLGLGRLKIATLRPLQMLIHFGITVPF